VGLLALGQTPNWRTRVSLFVWVINLDLSGMGGPTISIRYCQHSSWDHVTTQAPPLRQSRDTFCYYLYKLYKSNATSWKVAGSSHDVTGIFHWIDASSWYIDWFILRCTVNETAKFVFGKTHQSFDGRLHVHLGHCQGAARDVTRSVADPGGLAV
jgi:hypothetical protein